MLKRFTSGVAALTFALCTAGLSTQAAAEGDYLLATASTGGTYYPVGVALSTLVKVKLQPKDKINMSAINSAGSGENIKLLRENETQFAILQGLYGAYAWNGSGPLEKDGPQKGLRAVTMLWQNVEHFLVKAEYAKTGTIADASNIQSVAGFGKKNSGSLGSSRTIFGNLGIDIDKQFDLFYGGYGALADAMQDGKADLIGTPAGVPVGAVTKLLAAKGDAVRLLGFTADQAAKADGGMELWTPYLIPAGTYPGQQADITTIAQPNFLAVRADVPDDDVYKITKTIYENLGFLQSIHKATNAMALDKAISGLPMPLHPGAARYFKEAGLEIPARLIAQ
ncbi:MAG: TAXI family TRAP transporter solute-binding subunit [Chromatiaceae bacterium]|nr:TAXI family TRAP transporter solute-binding subunit [Gammaproteobacteria bacterium]MCP5315812.1 TAXI family TRAP transporter solute-binding subunit [Chromatiaceae bacterium]